MSDFDFCLFSDGGGQRGSVAAGACIVEDCLTGERFQRVAFLDGATNNEAEISSSLLGFAVIRNILASRRDVPIKPRIKWLSDSEYVLKSATQYIHGWQKNGWKTADKKPVKNQGLWRTFLVLAKGIEIKSEHVRGHTGHTENEACDAASTWAMEQAIEFGEEVFVGGAYSLGGFAAEGSWFLLDGREFIARAREDGADGVALSGLLSTLAVQAAASSGSTPKKRSASATSKSASAKGAGKKEGNLVKSLCDSLESALTTAKSLSNSNPAATPIAEDLLAILRVAKEL